MSDSQDTSTTPGLRKGALGAVGAAVISMAFMGPATSVFFNTPLAAGAAGYALPLAILLAMIVCLLVASVIASFARKLPTAGFAYTFNTHGFGRHGGFASGWLLLLAYGMVGPMLLSAIGSFTSAFLKDQFSWNVPWWIFTILFGAVVWGISGLGVSQSAKTALIFLVLELGVLLALFAIIFGKGGADGITLAPFNPGSSPDGIGGLGKGMLWGILMFIGFESAGTLGEEARSAKRAIPIALFTAVLAIGLFYVLSGYAAAIGFGDTAALRDDAEPWTTLMNKFWGVGWLLALTVLNSQFANLISGVTAQVRVVFAMGREGLLPRLLGRVGARQVPQAALAGYMLFSLAAALIGGAWIKPMGMYSFAGTIVGVAMVIVYISISIALIRYYRREHPSEFSLLKHGVVPVAAALLLLMPIYGQLVPLPTGPNRVALVLIVAWMVVGLAYLAWIVRSRPALLDAMGRVWAEDEDSVAGSSSTISSDSSSSSISRSGR
ncbi:APC family permease [Actinomadura barringtoniae]|uniref:APC family permease n=1 Tax=Actinomadura barringtoniae TaxID=1427535 RepID=A0A939PSR6_9ACTN|nr:APC family permease [Actinomadura barringtoniae]MBO2455583.1 APC family permease [Actinomadura barringtoniae]